VQVRECLRIPLAVPVVRASLERDARVLLLAAATDLSAVHGVAATTFAMIAKRAGLTPAMVHYYFIDREQLLDAVVEERIAPLIASVWGPVNASDAPAEIIRGVVERMLAGIAADALDFRRPGCERY